MQRDDACTNWASIAGPWKARCFLKSCSAEQRCLHLQDWHDSAVQGTVAVAKPYGAARRCVHLQDSRCSADRAKSNPAFPWTATGARRRGRKRGMQSEPRARRAGLRRCSADRAKSNSALTWTGNSARGRSARHCACGQFLQDSATMPAPARMA